MDGFCPQAPFSIKKISFNEKVSFDVSISVLEKDYKCVLPVQLGV